MRFMLACRRDRISPAEPVYSFTLTCQIPHFFPNGEDENSIAHFLPDGGAKKQQVESAGYQTRLRLFFRSGLSFTVFPSKPECALIPLRLAFCVNYDDPRLRALDFDGTRAGFPIYRLNERLNTAWIKPGIVQPGSRSNWRSIIQASQMPQRRLARILQVLPGR